MQQIKNGFSLLELLITFSIIGILLLCSLPIYSHYQVKENRLEAVGLLASLALAMEEYHIEHQTYETATLYDLHFNEVMVRGNYRFAIQNKTQFQYELHALPLQQQAMKDTECGTLIVNEKADKKITGHAQIETCW